MLRIANKYNQAPSIVIFASPTLHATRTKTAELIGTTTIEDRGGIIAAMTTITAASAISTGAATTNQRIPELERDAATTSLQYPTSPKAQLRRSL
jgi:hypothetical protein